MNCLRSLRVAECGAQRLMAAFDSSTGQRVIAAAALRFSCFSILSDVRLVSRLCIFGGPTEPHFLQNMFIKCYVVWLSTNLIYSTTTGRYATEQTATLACNYIAVGHPKSPATEASPLRRGSKET